ncbi:hypothetical protein RhiirA1_541877 [Rhizophagus irregularis]|uniref:Uncharacterized protein n=1 Tax=Rhizophagus irregularis TaxID=588596 RepID=A0A2N0R0T3_9GLOM|nr:hypothetical protein RhiirA1_541877 [Rhizophagus irregularis]
MAPRPGYGIPLGGISLMAAPDSEVVEKFIGGISLGVTDDWMEKILKTVINYLIFWWENECYISILVNKLTMISNRRDGDFNEHYIIKLDSYEFWSIKRRRKYLEIAFEFILVLKALMHYEHLQTCGTLKSWKQVKDQFRNPKGFGFAEYADTVLRDVSCMYLVVKVRVMIKKIRELVVLPASEETDENTRKYLDQYEASRTVVSKKRERQREEEERANRRAKAEKERERSHGRENRERESERERERDCNRGRDRDRQARESRRKSYILDDEEEEQRRQAKRKTEMEMAFKEREIRCQYREETWQQIRKTNSRSGNNGEKVSGMAGTMTLKLIEVKKNITKTGVRWWFHRQQFRARELAMDEADRLREQQEIELEKHRLQTLESSLKTNEDFDDEEGIESKRKRRILVPSIEYSDNDNDENKTEEKEN